METLEVIATIPAHENPVSSLTLNGSRLYSGSLKSINVWGSNSLASVHKYTWRGGEVQNLI